MGLTRNSMKARWSAHISAAFKPGTRKCSALVNSIVKYGKENFTIEQIDSALSLIELSKKEQFWIKEFNSIVPNGYNITTGGERDFNLSQETKDKLSASHLNKKLSDSHKNSISSTLKGRVFSNKTKKLISINKSFVYYLKDLAGNIHKINHLSSFAKKYNMNRRSLCNVANGVRNSCYGWTKPTQQELDSNPNIIESNGE